MPNDETMRVLQLSREFVLNAIHRTVNPSMDPLFPALMYSINRSEGLALWLVRMQAEHPVAFAALTLGSLRAEDSHIRRVSLSGLIYSKRSSVDELLIAAAFDDDVRVRRLALEGCIERKSGSLDMVCAVLLNDDDPSLVDASKAAQSGRVIPFLELESADTFGMTP